MQKLINVLSVASFVVSGAIVAGGSYAYLNRDAIVDNVKAQVTEAATAAISDGLVGGLGGSLPVGGGDAGVPTTLPVLPF
jgi:hypothetical protein